VTETRILTGGDVQALLGWDECIAAVENAFRLHAEGRSLPPGVLGVRATGGGFHIKAAGLDLGRRYFVAKTNANFPDNPRRHALPAIQGVIVLCDADDGRPLAVMDSIEVTIRRCGIQGRAQLRALTRVLALRRAFAFDADAPTAQAYATDMSAELGIEVKAVATPAAGFAESDVGVTCTPSRTPFLRREDVRPGTFVAAVGADSSDKQELDPRLMAASVVVTDLLEQCATIGDLHHALEAGAMTRDGVHADLADLVTGRKAGRRSPAEVTIFDSTGTALQDVAAAAVVYEKAEAMGVGLRVALGAA
jgi:alanine dehydrogenase